MRKTAVALTLALPGVVGVAATAATSPVSAQEGPADALYTADLTGGAEVPAVATGATGVATLAYDADADEIDVVVATRGLDDIVAAHVHLGAPTENGPVVATLYGMLDDGIDRQGTLSRATIDDYGVQAVTDPESDEVLFGGTVADLNAALAAGEAYVNVHTVSNPDGEVRGQVAAVGAGPAFTDIAGSVHEAAIRALGGAGVLNGRTATTFDGAGSLTRGQMASVLDRALNLPATTTDAFGDDTGSVHAASIDRLAAAGIAQGTAPGTFSPNAPVRRDQMASFVARAYGLGDGAGLALFPDGGPTHGGAVDALVVAGVTNGVSASSFGAAQPVLRGQAASFVARAGGLAPAVPRVDDTVTVLHNNDGESVVLPDGEEGGAGRFVTVVDQAKAAAEAAGRPAVMLSSGDNFLAGPAFTASQEDGTFYDALLLDRIGYDAIALGNHDFDFGPDLLADFVAAVDEGQYLSANIDTSDEAALDALVESGRIAPRTTVQAGDVELGVVSVITPALPTISSPRNVVIDPDVVGVVQAQIDALNDEGVDTVILISHLQAIAEEVALTAQVSGIDVVIAGGGSELLANDDTDLLPSTDPAITVGPYPINAVNRDGAAVPVVTTTGGYRYLGQLVADLGPAGNVVRTTDDSDLLPVIGATPDAAIVEAVEAPVQEFIAELEADVIATTAVGLDGTRANIRTVETNFGNLIADGFAQQAEALAPGFGIDLGDRPVVGFVTGGGIRNESVIGPGQVTRADAFDALPFTNFLALVEEVDPALMLELLENSVANVENVDGRFAQVSGIEFTWDPDAPVGSRVVDVSLSDGTPIVVAGEAVPAGPTVAVATANFTANGGDSYPVLPFTALGISYREALENYLADPVAAGGLAGTVSAADYPVGGEGRITRV